MDAEYIGIIDVIWDDATSTKPRVEVALRFATDYEPDPAVVKLIEDRQKILDALVIPIMISIFSLFSIIYFTIFEFLLFNMYSTSFMNAFGNVLLCSNVRTCSPSRTTATFYQANVSAKCQAASRHSSSALSTTLSARNVLWFVGVKSEATEITSM